MSNPAKRKGPPTKAEIIQRAVNDGIVTESSQLEKLSVKAIRLFIKEAKDKQAAAAATDGWIGSVGAEHIEHDNHIADKPLGDIPDPTARVKEFPEITEIREPNCGHIFRKVLEIHSSGNIRVNICNKCGWRELVE